MEFAPPHLRKTAFRRILYSPGFKEEAISVVMDSLARANEARPVVVHCDSLEVGDTKKAGLLNCSLCLRCPFVCQAKEILGCEW